MGVASSILLAQIGPVAWVLALGLPVAGIGWGVLRRSASRETRARRALENAKRAIASARVDAAWGQLEAALQLDATPSPAAAEISREVLHQVQRLVAPEIEADVARVLRPLDHALEQIAAGAVADPAIARAAIVRALIAARGEPVPAVLAMLAKSTSTTNPPTPPAGAVLAS